MAKMSKTQMYGMLAEKSGMTKKQVGEMMDHLAAMAYDEVKKSGEFALPGFGKIVKKRREARMGRNPMTGAQIQIPAKTVVKFRLAKALKDAVL